MIQQNYSLRKRQFRNLSKQINGLMKSQKWQELSQEQQSRLAGRFHKLFGQIRSLFTKRELKKVLAGTAMLIGLSGAMQAQDFAAPVTNAFDLEAVADLSSPVLVDIDNDGDLDMFVAEYNYPAGNLVYFQNIGTSADPVFDNPQTNPFGFSTTSEYIIFPNFADMDADGDMDIVGIGYNNAINFYYFENTGTANMPAFGPQQFNPFGLQIFGESLDTAIADMDEDGDLDILLGGRKYVGSGYEAVMVYYENVGTSTVANFIAPQTSLFNASSIADALFPEVGDLDKDGDFDVLAGSAYGNLYYFENTGSTASPVFALPQTNPFNLTAVNGFAFPTLGDIDADGDLDLFVGEYGGNYIGNTQFFENVVEVAIKDSEKESTFNIFPNPARKQITVQLTAQLFGESHVSIINELGMIVRQATLTNSQKTLNIRGLPAGFYMIELKTEKEQFVKKLIIK